VRGQPEFKELEPTIGALEGRDGWLFVSGDSNDVIAQHTGSYQPGVDWERQWSKLLRRRRRLMRRTGTDWFHMVIPDREAVYAEMLPPQVVPAARRPVHRLLELAAAERVEIFYPLDELRAAGTPKSPVYMQMDTHWNARGSYLGYRLVCDRLRRRGIALNLVGEDEIKWFDVAAPGDLGGKFDPPREGIHSVGRIRSPRARLVGDNGIQVTARRLEFESDRPGLANVVIFGSSYATLALPFFAESFHRLSFVHTTSIDRETLRAERPDAVVMMTAERGLRRVPDDRGASEALAELERRKRADGVLSPPGELEQLGMPPRAT
jgi:alginate O-acetyltransferase complex protein AlgJ